ncbi:IS3 family transposase [Mesomycoplasma dispar]|uniref:Integrase catalytic domain-containing protein n=1 Tax=Mesomycoplasma dispar TaxID=86660 RepID=A0ABM6PR08_9BACT|nr:IS3 family transposase [Mesomycoplasma dispar]ATP59472.1 hypothetical protein CSW10_00650 [Mesomycoplasma dispar]
MAKENNAIISMSRIGNSLGNPEVKYFFSNLKSECISQINIKKLTFVGLKEQIKNYVNFYNQKRIQSNLNWKTSEQVWKSLSF